MPDETSNTDNVDEDDNAFSLGPPAPDLDPNHQPLITDEQEATFVEAANAGVDHPDSQFGEDDRPDELTDQEPEEELPGDDELDALVADVDTDAVDQEGWSKSDVFSIPDLGGV